jgi:hypothetical protein
VLQGRPGRFFLRCGAGSCACNRAKPERAPSVRNVLKTVIGANRGDQHGGDLNNQNVRITNRCDRV